MLGGGWVTWGHLGDFLAGLRGAKGGTSYRPPMNVIVCGRQPSMFTLEHSTPPGIYQFRISNSPLNSSVATTFFPSV